MNPRPPNGFLSYFDNHPIPTQHVEGSQTVPINVDIGGNDEDVERTEKRLSWTQEEDLRLVGYLCFFLYSIWHDVTKLPFVII